MNDDAVLQEFQQFDHFLQNNLSMTLVEVHGLLSALVSSPVETPLDDIIDSLGFNELPASPEVDAAKAQLETWHDMIQAAFEQDLFKPLIAIEELDDENPEELLNAIQEWTNGYLDGVSIDMDDWLDLGGEEIHSLLMPLHVFVLTDEELADFVEDGEEKLNPQEFRLSLVDTFSEVPSAIYQFWSGDSDMDEEENEEFDGELIEDELALNDDEFMLAGDDGHGHDHDEHGCCGHDHDHHHHHAHGPYLKPVEADTGRNDPCHCGSGKKFKKCCYVEA